MRNVKWCTKCDKLKPLSEYDLTKNKTDGRRADCKICRKEYKDSYRKSAKYKDTQELYYKTNAYKESQELYRNSEKGKLVNILKASKRRALKLNTGKYNTPHENYLIECIYAFCKFKSAYTNILHHVDHKYPLSKGGRHHPDNLQILTATKNFQKGNKVLQEYKWTTT